MARGPKLTNEHKAYIVNLYRSNPLLTAKEIRNQVSEKFNINKSFPSLSSVQKILWNAKRKLKNELIKPSEEDELWGLASLNSFPIPDENLSEIFSMYSRVFLVHGISLTIREVKWLSRILSLFKISKITYKNYYIVYAIAKTYAELEKTYNLINKPFDSSIIDLILINFGMLLSYPSIAEQLLYDDSFYERICTIPDTIFNVYFKDGGNALPKHILKYKNLIYQYLDNLKQIIQNARAYIKENEDKIEYAEHPWEKLVQLVSKGTDNTK